jgi:hypothetical protein
MKCGIVAVWTGVIWAKPMVETASRIHAGRAGVKASQARGFFLAGAAFADAMITSVSLGSQLVSNGMAECRSWRGPSSQKVKLSQKIILTIAYRYGGGV